MFHCTRGGQRSDKHGAVLGGSVGAALVLADGAIEGIELSCVEGEVLGLVLGNADGAAVGCDVPLRRHEQARAGLQNQPIKPL